QLAWPVLSRRVWLETQSLWISQQLGQNCEERIQALNRVGPVRFEFWPNLSCIVIIVQFGIVVELTRFPHANLAGDAVQVLLKLQDDGVIVSLVPFRAALAF